MVNPSRKLRVKIDQVAKHPWVQSVFNESYLPVSDTWKKKTFTSYARDFNLTIEAVASEIKTRPYGRLGGIYNIEKHLYQKNTIELKKARSGTSVIKVINHHLSIFPSQISTLLAENAIELLNAS